VAATSPNNAWAVGYYITSVPDREQKTLIEHWDGSAWSQVPSPNSSDTFNVLNGVAATSPNNAWAVGLHYSNGTPSKTLALNCGSQDPIQGGDSQGQNQGGSQGQNQGGFQGQNQGC
jgi:hypothetical protein